MMINAETGYTLFGWDDLKLVQDHWNHIPRRKTVELHMIDMKTGEIMKVKSKK